MKGERETAVEMLCFGRREKSKHSNTLLERERRKESAQPSLSHRGKKRLIWVDLIGCVSYEKEAIHTFQHL